MTIYNHMYTVAFTVISENGGENVEPHELLDGLQKRLHDLARDGSIVEACGMPQDTYVEEE